MVEPKLRRSQLNKSTHDLNLTPTGFEKRKSCGGGFASSQYFKKPDDLREKSGKKTKIGQGLFNRRTQSGASNNFLMGSHSHNLLPAFDDFDDDSSLTLATRGSGNSYNVPNLNLSTSMKTLPQYSKQQSLKKQQTLDSMPSARNITPKPTTIPSYMNTTKASAQKSGTRVVKSSQKIASRSGLTSGYKSTGRTGVQTNGDKSVF